MPGTAPENGAVLCVCPLAIHPRGPYNGFCEICGKEGASPLFTKKELRALLAPLVIEQVLTGLMGVADTFMVSNVGEAAISGVALVDSINTLVIYFFSALAAGGTIVCSQYIGHRDDANANHASCQVMGLSLAMSLAFTILLAPVRRPLLGLIFGTVERSVMDAADVYMLVTVLSYPFLSVYTASAALYRATGDARLPMIVAAAADIMNIIGNAVLIFGFHMGVLGAALATLASRIFSAAVMLWRQARPGQIISLGGVRAYRPDAAMLRRIMRVGLPSAVENGMFQFGKLVVQSTVSLLGTTAIAAQAVITTLESCAVMPAQAVGIGLLTVTGQCIGQGRPDEARRYISMFTKLATVVALLMGGLISAAIIPITRLTALTPEGVRMVCQITWFIAVMRVLFWPCAFTLPNGLRAAGDVSYAMLVSTLSMWLFRVALCWGLCRYTPVGLWGVWFGWTGDWVVRTVCFVRRFRGDKWLDHDVLR